MHKKPRKKENRKPHELVAFLALWAVDFAARNELDGLHPTHYRLMKKYGARMDSFKEATNVGKP